MSRSSREHSKNSDKKEELKEAHGLYEDQSPVSNGVRSNYEKRGFEELTLSTSPNKVQINENMNSAYVSAADMQDQKERNDYLENLNLNE